MFGKFGKYQYFRKYGIGVLLWKSLPIDDSKEQWNIPRLIKL